VADGINFSAVDENCITPESEVLTPTGYKRIDMLEDGEPIAQWDFDGTIKYVIPSKVIRKPYTGQLVSLQGRSNQRPFSQLLTPDHRVVRRYSNNNEQLILGFHSSDYATVQSVEQGVGWRPLALNPSGGDVGIGTTSPTAKLQVSGDVTIGSTSAETRLTVDGGVKASGLWLNNYTGWRGTNTTEGWHSVIATGSISSSGGSTSLDILSIYTDGHWGGGMYGEIWVLTPYYGAGYKRYSFKAPRGGYATLTLLEENGYESPQTIDISSTAVVGSGTHGGQSVFKTVIRMNTNSSYVQAKAIIKIGQSDNSRKIFDNRSTDANVQADRVTEGGAYHFRSVDLSGSPNIYTV